MMILIYFSKNQIYKILSKTQFQLIKCIKTIYNLTNLLWLFKNLQKVKMKDKFYKIKTMNY